MSGLVSFEVLLTNHVPDPILFAFVTGLLISTVLIPEVWKRLRPHLEGPPKSKIVDEEIRAITITPLVTITPMPDGSTNRRLSNKLDYVLGIRNSGPDKLENCLVKVEAIKGKQIVPLSTSRALRTYRQTEEERSGGFNLRSGEPKDILICEVCSETGNACHVPLSVRILFEKDPPDIESHLSPGEVYEVTLGFYGAPEPRKITLSLGPYENGKYEVKKIDEKR